MYGVTAKSSVPTTMSIIYKILFFQVYIDVGQELNELNRETGFAATIDAMFALIVGTRQLRWSTCCLKF